MGTGNWILSLHVAQPANIPAEPFPWLLSYSYIVVKRYHDHGNLKSI